jgi:endonuclease/exonuclease/phosphatase family metal-dependent hydrolase
MRILSYNIHKGIGGRDRLYRLERVVGVIEHENPDLICLQEVDRHCRRSSNHDQPKLLAEHFRAVAHAYQLNFHVDRGGYGNLVLSRWTFLRQHHISLRLHRRKTRGAQILLVETPEGPLRLVNCHLGLAESERQWQLEHLLGHHLFTESAEHPTASAAFQPTCRWVHSTRHLPAMCKSCKRESCARRLRVSPPTTCRW